MRRLELASLSLLACVVLPLVPAIAQDDNIFQPSRETEQPTRPSRPEGSPQDTATTSVQSLIGTWRVDQKGNPTCTDGIITFRSHGTKGVSADSQFGDFPGEIADISVSGDNVSFSNSYIDLFGDPQTVVRRGKLSADHNTITGKLEGSWQDGCTFIMVR